MSFAAAIRSVFTQYVGFKGRARRSEFWWFYLFSALVYLVASIFDAMLGIDSGILGLIALLALALPGVAVAVRRLHDTDHSGWLYLLSLVPIIGSVILLIFFAKDGTSGLNRFGPSPKDGPLQDGVTGATA